MMHHCAGDSGEVRVAVVQPNTGEHTQQGRRHPGGGEGARGHGVRRNGATEDAAMMDAPPQPKP